MNIVEMWILMFPGGLGWFLVITILVLGIAHMQAFKTSWAVLPCVLLSVVCAGILWIGLDLYLGAYPLEDSVRFLVRSLPVVFGLVLMIGTTSPVWMKVRLVPSRSQ